MGLAIIDIILIVSFILITIGINLYYRVQAQKSLDNFLLGGRNLPWFIAGISMVATTFAADTPLAVTEIIAQNGIAGNWLWWNFLAGGLLTTFFFAGLWKKSGVLTEMELIEIRYSGKAAKFLRIYKAIFFGLIINAAIISWVSNAMIEIFIGLFDLERSTALIIVIGLMFFTAVYSAIGGLKGIAVTDNVQFFIAMTACIVLAFFVISSPEIGGMTQLKNSLPKTALRFFPAIGNQSQGEFSLPISHFLAYMGFMWFVSWYPGFEPGGGGYIVQRVLATKNERGAFFSNLLFIASHFVLRPWPWIVVGVGALVLFPDIMQNNPKMGYVAAIDKFMPAGLKGLLFVSFLGAFMSTISTQLNWGVGFLVNDVYKQITKPKKEILVSRLATIFLVIIGIFFTTIFESIKDAWRFVLDSSAGMGLVLILRWYWHRINVWSEIVATLLPFFIYLTISMAKMHFGANDWWTEFPNSFFISVILTTISWVVVTFMTKAEKPTTLANFYQKIRPQGWWKPITGKTFINLDLGFRFLAFIGTLVAVYSLMFSIGYLVFGYYERLILSLTFLIIGTTLSVHYIHRMKMER